MSLEAIQCHFFKALRPGLRPKEMESLHQGHGDLSKVQGSLTRQVVLDCKYSPWGFLIQPKVGTSGPKKPPGERTCIRSRTPGQDNFVLAGRNLFPTTFFFGIFF